MLFLTSMLSTGQTMPDFCFFKKGKHITALERSDAEKTAQLGDDGWEKLFEEIRAPDAETALIRLADIRKEEAMTEPAFITGSAFSSLLTAILK